MDEYKYLPCTFTGFKIDPEKDNYLVLQQNYYVTKRNPPKEEYLFFNFVSMRICMAWLSHSRSGFLF